MAKLKIGFYPYAFVRTNVMRSLLLKREDYHKLMKMSVPEITKYLQDRHYKDDIGKFGGSGYSTEFIEMALSHNVDRSFMKLRRIVNGNLSILVDAYLERYDILNIKTVLRAVKTGQDREEAEMLISGAGTYNKEFYMDSLNSSTVKDAIGKMAGNVFIESEMEDMSLQEIESELDKEYYRMLLEIADRLPQNAQAFKEFILTEIDVLNIMTVLRLKREGVSSAKIKSLLVLPESRSMLSDLADAADTKSIFSRLGRTKYRDMMSEGAEEFENTGSLVSLERLLNKYLLRKSVLLLHQNILSANVILGYMFAKEIEVRNLRLLIKGKKFGLDDEYIERELII